MKNTLFKSSRLALLLGALSAAPAHAFFGSGIVHDPVHMGQTIAEGAQRAAEAAREIQVEISQYQQMVRDGLSLADPVFKPIGDTFRSLHSVYMQSQSLMYRAQNLDSAFGMMYPSYYSYLGTMGQGRSTAATMRERYKVWSDKGYENTRTAMNAAGVQVNGMSSEQAMLERLIAQSNSADGQKQAIQAASLIAANQAEQLQDLRMMVADQTSLHANFMALQIERQSHSDAFSESYRRAPVVHTQSEEF